MRTTGMNLLDQLGYIDPNKVRRDHNGRIVSLQPGANVKAGEFASDPALFAGSLVDSMSKKISDDPAIQRQWISQIFGNRNAAQQLGTLFYQALRLNRGADAIKSTLGIDAGSNELLGNDGWTAWDRLKSSVSNFFGIGGEKAMPAYEWLMNHSADAFGRQAEAINNGQFWPAPWGAPPVAAAASSIPYSLDYYHEAEIRADPEAHRAAIMGSKSFANATQQAAPSVSVNVAAPNVQVSVSVAVDGKNIPASTTQTVRVTNNANGFDGRAAEQWPDGGFH
jgi:hypothetical protein